MITYSIIQKSQLEGANRLDAEYYQPKYLEAIALLNKINAEPLSTSLKDVRYGLYAEPNYQSFGINFLRGLNLLDLDIGGEILKIEEKVIPNTNYLLKEGDILIARSGSVGAVGLIYKNLVRSTFGSYTIRIRVKELNPEFLYIFLKTKFGRFQVERLSTQVAQPNINVPNLKILKIPIPPKDLQGQISQLVRKVHNNVLTSESFYYQAEQTILDEVGFEKIDFNVKKPFMVNLLETKGDKRIDGEHFHTKFKNLREYLLKTKKAKFLKELRTFIKRGFQPEYVESGEIIVINSQHLGRALLNIEDTERTDRNFFEQNKRAQLKNKDILFYSTGAYIGRTNIYLEEKEAIASNHVTIIRTNKECDPVYLAVYLNSPLGLMQSEQWASGSAQREIYPDDIDKFLVYLPRPQFQQKIADLVRKSHEARKKAKQLLEEAKREVETSIETQSKGDD